LKSTLLKRVTSLSDTREPKPRNSPQQEEERCDEPKMSEEEEINCGPRSVETNKKKYSFFIFNDKKIRKSSPSHESELEHMNNNKNI